MKKTSRVFTPTFKMIFFLILLLIAAMHFWIAWFATQSFQVAGIWVSLLYFFGFCSMPLAFMLSRREPRSKMYFLVWAGYIWMGFYFTSLWLSALAAIVFLFFPIEMYSIHVLSVSLVLTLYALYRGLQSPQLRIEKIKESKLVGLRIVQITDLHMGLLAADKNWLQKVVDKIKALSPDFIFLTGDLVEGSLIQVGPMLEPLTDLVASLDKVYISGNHEMIHGGLLWEDVLLQKGWRVLHNQNKIYNWNNKKILVAGVPDKMIKRFNSEYNSDPDLALKTNQSVDYKILLAHEPSSVFDLKNEKPDIILAGHTHGGQIFPFGWIVRIVQPVVAGWKRVQGILIYAHTGTGIWGPPMRLGTRNQIVLFEFIEA